MKGIKGLIIAIGLGLAGAMFNWAYLTNKTNSIVEREYFIAVAPNATIDRGDKLTDEKLVSLGIPRAAVGNLSKIAYFYADRQTVIGSTVWRNLEGGSLLLRDDLKTPPQELVFGQTLDEGVEDRAMSIPVDSSRFVPSLSEPGDMVSFVFPKYRGPTPASPPPAKKPAKDGASGLDDDAVAKPAETTAVTLKPIPEAIPPATPVQGPTEIVGPFKILALGNRLGKSEIMRASKIPQVQENVILISVKLTGGELDPMAQKLWGLLQVTGPQQMGILLHPRKR